MHYNSILMHLDVCNLFVGWAYDAICFACHMFMHFPCIRTLFSIYLLYLNCLGLFWLSFLSLPLFLFTLVVSMAPKHKSTPARNLLHSGATLSSDPTPSNIRFCDEDARKAFSENFSKRGVHSVCQVILADFTDTDLPTIIHNQEWESLCDVLVTYPLVLIQESPTCMRLIVKYLFSSLAFEVRTFLSHHNLLRMCFGSLG